MRRNKVDIITLGCSKNLVDTEHLLRQFQACGYTVEHNPKRVNGEIVVVNTCGFIADAQAESIDTILQLCQARKKGTIMRLFVMGCLSERFKADLMEEIPEVDNYYGKFDWKLMLHDRARATAKSWPPSGCSPPRATTPTSKSAKAATASARSAPSRSSRAATIPCPCSSCSTRRASWWTPA